MNSDISRVDSIRSYDFVENGTLSNRILNNLKQLAAKNGKKIFVEGVDSPIETYHYDDESVRIVKRLHDATVGEDGGEIRYYAEWVDYRRFDWWKAALEKLPIYFLDIPVDHFAIEGGFSNSEAIFSPQKVTESYHLNPQQDEDRQIACIQWVQDQVVKILDPKLAPDYRVRFLEGRFRLEPRTPEAIESRLINNASYEKAKAAVLDAIGPLKEAYERMSKKLAVS